MDDLIIMKRAPLALQVCTTLSIEDATVELNRIDLCGTQNGWVFQDDREDNPVQCLEHPDRKHMVFVC